MAVHPTTIWTCSAKRARPRCLPKACPPTPVPSMPHSPCRRPRLTARARWAWAIASVRSCRASRRIWSPCAWMRWRPNPFTTRFRNSPTPPAAIRSVMCGLPECAKWKMAHCVQSTRKRCVRRRRRGARASRRTEMSAVNVSSAETAKFDRLAARWWDKDGESRPLHDLNPARLNYIAERVALKGARVLDVGCGGGILSEALARAGAQVTGIDLAPRVLDVARLHLHESGLRVEYREIAVEALAAEMPATLDAVACMEMLEHVPDPGSVVVACAALLKPGGRLYLSTLNRTALAFGAAIVGAEYVANLLPRGTHHYAQFIRPSELAAVMRGSGLALEDLSGIDYNPFTRRVAIAKSTQVNYLTCARKDRKSTRLN